MIFRNFLIFELNNLEFSIISDFLGIEKEIRSRIYNKGSKRVELYRVNCLVLFSDL